MNRRLASSIGLRARNSRSTRSSPRSREADVLLIGCRRWTWPSAFGAGGVVPGFGGQAAERDHRPRDVRTRRAGALRTFPDGPHVRGRVSRRSAAPDRDTNGRSSRSSILRSRASGQSSRPSLPRPIAASVSQSGLAVLETLPEVAEGFVAVDHSCAGNRWTREIASPGGPRRHRGVSRERDPCRIDRPGSRCRRDWRPPVVCRCHRRKQSNRSPGDPAR